MKQTLKIGLVLDDSLDRPDGVQQYVLTLGDWLMRQGHEVQYLVGETTTKRTLSAVHSLSKNLKVRFNRNRLSLPLPADKNRLHLLLQKEKFDVLHVQMPFSPWLAGRVIQAAAPQTAIVGTFHIVPHSKLVLHASRLLSVYERRPLKLFQAVASVSSAAQGFAQQAFHLDSVVIPNAINLDPYKKLSARRSSADTVTIVFLGRLVERKGCRYLLRAVDQLVTRSDVASFRVVIGGRGQLEASLKRYVAERKLQDVVHFRGFIAESDKPSFLAGADIAVFPSTGGESFGIVLLEAMAASRGVVLAGDNVGYASVMQPKPEQLVHPTQTDAFANKLAYYINNATAREAARVWQRSYVQQFSIDVVGPRILDLYARALHGRSDVR